MKPTFNVDLNITKQSAEEFAIDREICESKIKKLLVFYKRYKAVSFFTDLFWVLIVGILFIPILKVNNPLIATLYDDLGITHNGSISYYRYAFKLSDLMKEGVDKTISLFFSYLSPLNIDGILNIIGQIGFIFIILMGGIGLWGVVPKLIGGMFDTTNKMEMKLRDDMAVVMNYEEVVKPAVWKLLIHIVFCIIGLVFLFISVARPMLELIHDPSLPPEFTASYWPVILTMLLGVIAICFSISKKWLKCKYKNAYDLLT